MLEPLLSVAPVFVYLKAVKLGKLLMLSPVSWRVHSMSCWQSGVVDVTVWVTLVPFVVFLTRTVPVVFDVAVTVTLIESPALIWGPDMPAATLPK
jgi:hypothetical protein